MTKDPIGPGSILSFDDDWRLGAVQVMQRTAMIAFVLVLLWIPIDVQLAPHTWFPWMLICRLALALYLAAFSYVAYRLFDHLGERRIMATLIEGKKALAAVLGMIERRQVEMQEVRSIDDTAHPKAMAEAQSGGEGDHLDTGNAKNHFERAESLIRRKLDDKIQITFYLGVAAHMFVGIDFLALNWIANEFHTNYVTGMILLFIAISMVPWESRRWAFWQLFSLAYAFIILGALHYQLNWPGFDGQVPMREGLIANGAFIWGAALLCWIGTRRTWLSCTSGRSISGLSPALPSPPQGESREKTRDRPTKRAGEPSKSVSHGPLFPFLLRLSGSSELAEGLQLVLVALIYVVLWIAVLISAGVDGSSVGKGGEALFAYVLVTLIVPLAVAASRFALGDKAGGSKGKGGDKA